MAKPKSKFGIICDIIAKIALIHIYAYNSHRFLKLATFCAFFKSRIFYNCRHLRLLLFKKVIFNKSYSTHDDPYHLHFLNVRLF